MARFGSAEPTRVNPDRARLLRLAEVAIFTAAALAPLWLPGPIITIDGPQHVLTGFLWNHLGDAGTPWAAVLAPQIPLTSLFAPASVALFERFVPVVVAEQCTLSLMALVMVFGVRRLVIVAQGPGSPWRWAALLMPFTPALYFGLYNYAFALACGAWVLAGFLPLLALDRGGSEASGRQADVSPPAGRRRRVGSGRARWLRWGAVGAGLFATALAHAFAACVLGLCLGIAAAGAVPWRRLPAVLGRLLVVSAPTLVWAGRVASAVGASEGRPRLEELGMAGLGWEGLYRNLFETPYHTVHAGAVLVLVALASAGVGLARSWRRPTWRRGLALAALVMGGAALLLPDRIQAWQKLPIRFVPWLALLSLAAAWAPARARSARIAVSAVVAATVVAGLATITGDNEALAALRTELSAGLREGPRGAQLCYFLRPDAEAGPAGANMLVNAHAYDMLATGCLYPFVFRNRLETHGLRETPGWGRRFPDLRPSTAGLPREIAQQVEVRRALRFDAVLAVAIAPGQAAELAADGFAVFGGNALVTWWTPPHRQLEVAMTDVPDGSFELAVVFGDLLTPFASAPLEADPSGRARVRLTDLPARTVTLGVVGSSPNGAQRGLASIEVDLTAGDRALALPFPAPTPGPPGATPDD